MSAFLQLTGVIAWGYLGLQALAWGIERLMTRLLDPIRTTDDPAEVSRG